MDPITIAAIVGVLGNVVAGGFAAQSASDTANKNRAFQREQSALDREQSASQFNQSLGQRKYEFASEAPTRAANVFTSLQPALKEKRKSQDLTAAWSALGSRK